MKNLHILLVWKRTKMLSCYYIFKESQWQKVLMSFKYNSFRPKLLSYSTGCVYLFFSKFFQIFENSWSVLIVKTCIFEAEFFPSKCFVSINFNWWIMGTDSNLYVSKDLLFEERLKGKPRIKIWMWILLVTAESWSQDFFSILLACKNKDNAFFSYRKQI